MADDTPATPNAPGNPNGDLGYHPFTSLADTRDVTAAHQANQIVANAQLQSQEAHQARNKALADANEKAVEEGANPFTHPTAHGDGTLPDADARPNSAIIKDAWDLELTKGIINYATRQAFVPDDSYNGDAIAADAKKLLEATADPELRDKIADNLGVPVSRDDFNARVQRIQEQYAAEQRLIKDGSTGTGARMLVGMLDPASLAVGTAGGAFFTTAAKVGRIAWATRGLGRTALDAAGGMTAINAAHSLVDPISPDFHSDIESLGQGMIVAGIMHGAHVYGPAASRYLLAEGRRFVADESGSLNLYRDLKSAAEGNEPAALKDVARRENAHEGGPGMSPHPDEMPQLGMDEAAAPHPADGGIVDNIAAQVEGATGSRIDPGVTQALKDIEGNLRGTQAGPKVAEAVDRGATETTAEDLARARLDHEDIAGHQAFRPANQEFDQKPFAGDEPLKIDGKGLAALADGDVPTAFGQLPRWLGGGSTRFDIAGYLGTRQSPVVRLAAGHILNNSAGNVGGRVMAQPVDNYRIRLIHRELTKYADSRNPALHEWASSLPGNPGKVLSLANGAKQFDELVGRLRGNYLRRGETPDSFHPAVHKAAKGADDAYETMKGLYENPLAESGGVGRKMVTEHGLREGRYLNQKVDAAKFRQKLEQLGNGDMDLGRDRFIGHVGEAMAKANPKLKPETVKALATDWVDNVHARINGNGDELGAAFAMQNRERLTDLLQKSGKLSADEITRLVEDVAPQTTRDGVSSNMKSRVLMDVNHWKEFAAPDGKMVTHYIHDVFVHDQAELLGGYMHKNAGAVAMAGLQVHDPRTGKLLIDGVHTDNEWAKVMSHVQDSQNKLIDLGKLSVEKAQEERKVLNFVWDQMLGRPIETSNTALADGLKLIRKINVPKMGNAGLLAHSAENLTAIHVLGFKAWAQHCGFKAVPEAMAEQWAGKKVELTALRNEWRTVGVGVENQHHMHGMGFTDADKAAMTRYTGNSKLMTQAHTMMDKVNQVVLDKTLLHPILDGQQSYAASGFSQLLSDFARKGQKAAADAAARGEKVTSYADLMPRAFRKRMNQLGLDGDKLDRIAKMMVDHTTVEPGVEGKITRLNFDKWKDQGASFAVQNAGFQASRKIIQSSDIGQASKLLMTNELAKTMFQFKSFVMKGWANHTLYALNHMEPSAFAAFASAMIGAGSLYVAHETLKNFGQWDSKEYKEAMNPLAIGLAGFQRAGYSSILPNLVDSVLPQVTNTKPLFDHRTSGSSSSFFQPPALQAFDSTIHGIGGAGRALMGRGAMSEQDLNGLTQMVPGATVAPIAGALHYFNRNVMGLTAHDKQPKQNVLQEATAQ